MNAASRKILVTGASGFVGMQLVSLLLEKGYAVTVVTRAQQRLLQCPWLQMVTVIEGDLADAALCARAVAGVDVVMHLAGLAHVGAGEEEHRQHNFVNTQHLALAAQQAGVQAFIFVSSCKARYPAHSAYGKYKLASEEFLQELKGPMRVTCLRPGIIYGVGMQNNLQTLLRILLRPVLPVFVSSEQKLGMISLADCCRALMATVEQDALAGKVWELTDGEGYTLNTLVSRIRQAAGLPLPLLLLPGMQVWPLFAVATLLPALRRRGMGLNTWRGLFQENYPADTAFAEASGVWPRDTLYKIMPELTAISRASKEPQ